MLHIPGWPSCNTLRKPSSANTPALSRPLLLVCCTAKVPTLLRAHLGLFLPVLQADVDAMALFALEVGDTLAARSLEVAYASALSIVQSRNTSTYK